MSTNKHLSLSNKTKNALERLDALESDFPQFVANVNNAVTTLSQQINGVSEVVTAIVKLLGPEVVATTIEDARKEGELKRVADTKAAIAQMTANGNLVSVPAVTEKSLLVGVEFDHEGKELFPGFVQLQYAQLKADFQQALLGQSVGFKLVTSEEGRSFVLGEIYEFSAPAIPEAPATEVAEPTPAPTVQ